MKLNCRLIAKIGLLLVVIGFFMPIACDQNGFEIADYMMKNDKAMDGLLIYLLFVSAVAGVGVGVFLLMKKKLNPSIDWLVIIVCIASGIILYFRLLKDGPDLQSGAYMILAGGIIAFASQVVSQVQKK